MGSIMSSSCLSCTIVFAAAAGDCAYLSASGAAGVSKAACGYLRLGLGAALYTLFQNVGAALNTRRGSQFALFGTFHFLHVSVVDAHPDSEGVRVVKFVQM